MARGTQIKCRGFVPDGNGGYRPLESLSPQEREEFSKKIVNRMGRVFEDYFSRHPEVYAKFEDEAPCLQIEPETKE